MIDVYMIFKATNMTTAVPTMATAAGLMAHEGSRPALRRDHEFSEMNIHAIKDFREPGPLLATLANPRDPVSEVVLEDADQPCFRITCFNVGGCRTVIY